MIDKMIKLKKYKYVIIIFLISLLTTIFFNLTSSIHFAGGGSHFLDWALAIVDEIQIVPDDIAQRDIGFTLIVLLSGFTITNSFNGIILIQSLFALLMPIIVYFCLNSFSKKIAFYVAIICILTLAPYLLIKFIYHDQTYIFLMILSLVFLLKYIQNFDKNYLLYLFTITILIASYTRSAGNYIYPILLILTYLIKPNKIKPYLVSLLIFLIGFSIYSYHRHLIFGLEGNRSGIGLQAFYSTYIPLGVERLPLYKDMGPNTKKLIEGLDDYIGNDLKNSKMMKIYDAPNDFLSSYIFTKTPDELKYELINNPCEEYMWILYGMFPNNDSVYRGVSIEIVKSYPITIAKHLIINSYSMLFKPGLNFGRYDTSGKRGISGVDFIPDQGTLGEGGPGMQDVRHYGQNLVDEINHRPLKNLHHQFVNIFNKTKELYIKHFRTWIKISNVLIINCWLFYLFYLYNITIRKKIYSNKIILLGNTTLLTSLYLLYEALMSAFFAGPHMRYFHFTELYRIVICGLSLNYIFNIKLFLNLKIRE